MKPHVTRLWESQCERLYGMKFIPRCLPSLFVLCRLTTVSVALYTQEAEQGSWVGGGWRVMMDGWVRGAGGGRGGLEEKLLLLRLMMTLVLMPLEFLMALYVRNTNTNVRIYR